MKPRVDGSRLRAIRSGSLSTGSSLATLGILYVVLIVLVVTFAVQLVQSPEPSPTRNLVLVASGALILVAVLILAYNASGIVRDLLRSRPGARFKARLLSVFLALVLLTALPHALLTASFFRTALDTWFTDEAGEAVAAGLDVALDAYTEADERIARITSSAIYRDILEGVVGQPATVWRTLGALDPGIDSMQVLDVDSGELIFAAGNERAFLTAPSLLQTVPENPSRIATGESSFLHVVIPVGDVLVSVADVIPAELERSARLLTDAQDTFASLSAFRSRFLRGLLLFYGMLSFPLVLLALITSFVVADELVTPIERLEAATRQVSIGNYSVRILAQPGDELGNLVASFNAMTRELERSRAKLRQTEKVSAWRDVARRLAHEVKNPLTPIRLTAERVLRKAGDPEAVTGMIQPAMQSILDQVNAMDRLIVEFRDFTRMPVREPRSILVPELAEGVASRYRSASVTILTGDIPGDLELIADPAQLERALSNLIANGIDAMNGEGRIEMRAARVMHGTQEYARMAVQDSGTGIDPALGEQVFDPYVTGKKGGTGLGLAIVEQIVIDHGGEIWFESEPGVGTTFVFDLPVGGTANADRTDR